MSSTRVATLPLHNADDVFVLRRSGRAAAAALGCDDPDQVRVATALSEIGREAVTHARGATAAFWLTAEGALSITIAGFPRAGTRANGAASGLDAARRLTDDVEVLDEGLADVVTIRLRLALPRRMTGVAPAELRAALAGAASPGPLDELRLENRSLVETLGELRAKQDELVRLNTELEDTNRGVMAMYAQLADELEETNRGVVALYAELDEKGVQLKAASEAKSRFLASVSHELRSPLNSILGLVRILLDPEDGALSGEQMRQLRLVSNASHELLRLVNELLDLAKAESGRIQPEPTTVDLGEVFSELRGSLRPLLQAGVELRVEMPAGLTVETDRSLLMQILRNLLTNALKFTTSGSVSLEARETAPYELEIAVADTGIGIAVEHQERIFEEFFQVRTALHARSKGTGLGLPYARRVTQTLGGELTVRSEPGTGSRFTLRLPLAWDAGLNASGSPGRQPPGDVQVGTVLIVDDDDGFRAALRGMLQGSAAQVLEASGGAEGLRLMRRSRPDLAFLDLRMPDVDGVRVLSEMSADPMLRDIPVVIVTSADVSSARPVVGPASALLSKIGLTRGSVRRTLAEVLHGA